ncbi:hypothetical protein M0812_21860 [Anaeramoeba flamelloides]|uniref:Calponin-homology (CH) domain-containing protein n=1 Tax=Anaeramoeba flamelloides TaxID=1746091 RepID=A0AAV7YTV3_9EUKA|nr:hypothetical protein M0812_21860 [Anaeramoeba flamelloides]
MTSRSSFLKLKKKVKETFKDKNFVLLVIRELKKKQMEKDLEEVLEWSRTLFSNPDLEREELLSFSGVQLINLLNVISPTKCILTKYCSFSQAQTIQNLQVYQNVLTTVFGYPTDSLFSIPSVIEQTKIAHQQIVQSLLFLKKQIEEKGSRKDKSHETRVLTLQSSDKLQNLVLGKQIKDNLFENQHYQLQEGLFILTREELKKEMELITERENKLLNSIMGIDTKNPEIEKEIVKRIEDAEKSSFKKKKFKRKKDLKSFQSKENGNKNNQKINSINKNNNNNNNKNKAPISSNLANNKGYNPNRNDTNIKKQEKDKKQTISQLNLKNILIPKHIKKQFSQIWQKEFQLKQFENKLIKRGFNEIQILYQLELEINNKEKKLNEKENQLIQRENVLNSKLFEKNNSTKKKKNVGKKSNSHSKANSYSKTNSSSISNSNSNSNSNSSSTSNSSSNFNYTFNSKNENVFKNKNEIQYGYENNNENENLIERGKERGEDKGQSKDNPINDDLLQKYQFNDLNIIKDSPNISIDIEIGYDIEYFQLKQLLEKKKKLLEKKEKQLKNQIEKIQTNFEKENIEPNPQNFIDNLLKNQQLNERKFKKKNQKIKKYFNKKKYDISSLDEINEYYTQKVNNKKNTNILGYNILSEKNVNIKEDDKELNNNNDSNQFSQELSIPNIIYNDIFLINQNKTFEKSIISPKYNKDSMNNNADEKLNEIQKENNKSNEDIYDIEREIEELAIVKKQLSKMEKNKIDPIHEHNYSLKESLPNENFKKINNDFKNIEKIIKTFSSNNSSSNQEKIYEGYDSETLITNEKEITNEGESESESEGEGDGEGEEAVESESLTENGSESQNESLNENNNESGSITRFTSETESEITSESDNENNTESESITRFASESEIESEIENDNDKEYMIDGDQSNRYHNDTISLSKFPENKSSLNKSGQSKKNIPKKRIRSRSTSSIRRQEF